MKTTKKKKINVNETEQSALRYLELPTTQLLEEFGKGSHVPGSGSAAAFSGLLAVELMRTVCLLTLQKDAYSEVHKEVEYILKLLQTKYKPKLMDLFYKDIKAFSKVSEARRKRDKEADAKLKERYGRDAAELLRVATEIPIQICETCLEVIDYALVIFDKGFKSARGDSGVAISNLLSGVAGSIFVIFLNIHVARQSKWSQEKRTIAESLTKKYLEIQREAFSRVVKLYTDGLPDDYKQEKLPFE